MSGSTPPPGGSRATGGRPADRPPAAPPERQPAVPGPAENKPLGALMGDMVADMGTLVRQEIALAKVETKEELTKAGKAAGMLGAAGLTAHMALLFLSLALALVLSQAINRAASFAIVGIVYALAAGGLLMAGRRQAKSINPVPQQTVDTLKEDVQWAKAQKN